MKVISKIFAFALISIALRAVAADVSVSNQIRVRSQTGNNQAKEGQVIVGSAEADIIVKTTINGQEVENTNEHYKTVEGEGLNITKTSSYVSSGTAAVTATATASSGKKMTVKKNWLINFLRNVWSIFKK